MKIRLAQAATVLLLLVVAAPTMGLAAPLAQRAPQKAAALPGTPMCFTATGYCLRGAFLLYWRVNGGLMQFGYPVSPELTEDGRTVQYTERARFELHDGQVLLGLLGAELNGGRIASAEAPFKAATATNGARFFPETAHNLGAPFRAYWESHGGLPVFGYPISEAFQEVSHSDNKRYQVQYFQRYRVEYHPENAGTPYEMQLGLMGTESYQAIYGVLPPLAPDPALAPDPVSLAQLRQQPRQGSDLTVVRQVNKSNAWTQYAITYISEGRKITGIMYVPAGRGPFPVILMAHGFIPISEYTTGMDSKRESPYLASNGYVTIHPDFRNYAGSDDDPEAPADMSTIGWTEDLLNLVAAVKASDLPYIDASRIGFWGHSNGGQVGLQTMSIDLDIKAYVLFAPTSPDYADNFNRWNRSGADAAAIKAKHGFPEDNPEWYRGISAGPWFDQVVAPVLLFHGTGDTNTPYEWSVRTNELLKAAGKDITFVSPRGENHLFSDRAFPAIGQQMLDFFAKYVKGE